VLPSNAHSLRLLIERGLARAGLELNVVADIDSLSTVILTAR
jgi:LysR family nitrogen assimilation transcriptional regulator